MIANQSINYMSIKEFHSEGYLQEVNRRFFHPLGLALEVRTNEDGAMSLGEIWDYRDDPEGIYYSGAVTKLPIFKSRVERFNELFEKKLLERKSLLGYGIQEPTIA